MGFSHEFWSDTGLVGEPISHAPQTDHAIKEAATVKTPYFYRGKPLLGGSKYMQGVARGRTLSLIAALLYALQLAKA